MFGVELERMWGTRFFAEVLLRLRRRRAALTMRARRCCPCRLRQPFYSLTSSARPGAIYGVLLAYALYFPNRPI